MTTTINKFDVITGVCTCMTSKGTYVQLNNGMTGLILNAFVPRDTAVLCSVTYLTNDENFVFLRLDSADYEAVA